MITETPIDLQWGWWCLPLFSQVTKTCINSRMSSNSARSDHWLWSQLPWKLKMFHTHIKGKWCLHASLFILDRNIIKVTGNHNRHKSSDEFDFGLDQSTHFGVIYFWGTKNLPFRHGISLRPIGQLLLKFICNIIWLGEIERKAMIRNQYNYLTPSVHDTKVKKNALKATAPQSTYYKQKAKRIWDRLAKNAGFHGNRRPKVTYNWDNDVSDFSRLFLFRAFLYLQVRRSCIKSRTNSNFGQMGLLITELYPFSIYKIPIDL